MLKALCGIALAALVSTAAHAGPMTVTDDPYKAVARAEIRQQLPAQTSFRRYCHTGGSLSLWIIRPRDGRTPYLGVTAQLQTLRSPGEIASIDLLGGLPLTEFTRDVANYDCLSSGCHNDAMVAYTIPAETAAAILAKGAIPLRISVAREPDCMIEGSITAEDVTQLTEWAKRP